MVQHSFVFIISSMILKDFGFYMLAIVVVFLIVSISLYITSTLGLPAGFISLFLALTGILIGYENHNKKE